MTIDTAVQTRRGWVRSHWKLLLVISLSIAIAGVVAAVFAMRSSDAVSLAISTAESNPALAEEIGQPLKIGWFISGSIEVTPASGRAELAIPVSGPKGKGTIYVEALKRSGLWQLQLLEFGADGSNKRLDLLNTPKYRGRPALTS